MIIKRNGKQKLTIQVHREEARLSVFGVLFTFGDARRAG